MKAISSRATGIARRFLHLEDLQSDFIKYRYLLQTAIFY